MEGDKADGCGLVEIDGPRWRVIEGWSQVDGGRYGLIEAGKGLIQVNGRLIEVDGG